MHDSDRFSVSSGGSPPPDLTSITQELPRLLAALERSMAEPESVADELWRARPADLHVAFAYELALLVRSGPRGADGGAHPSPAALLGLAQRGAAAGALSWLTPLMLRGQLAQLEADLHDAGAWDPEAPLWWCPLPARTAADELWASLDGGAGKPAALAEALEGTGWRIYPCLIAAGSLSEIAAEIEAAYESGRLQLESGGIGHGGRRAPQRSDEVAYLTGREPDLLAAAPRLAVLVQWLLGQFAADVADTAESLPGRRHQAPAKAMLARYPAPSAGYRPHLDNPGGREDNGRALTCVVYLNPPARECAGGELALWPSGAAVSAPPGALHAPRGGSAALFDSRTVPHQVLPLHEGPARWAITLWFQDGLSPAAPDPGVPRSPIPGITAMDALQAIPDPQLPPGALLVCELDDEHPGGRITTWRKSPVRPRVGLVTTVYRGGELLDRWCEHHLGGLGAPGGLDAGLDHLVLVFDHLEEPAEAADAARLRARYPAERLTLWSGAEVKAARWPALPPFPQREQLLEWAAAGAASFAVAARQTLNASAVLAAARTGELGGAPLDWLLHLDADEWLWLEGAGRGGATLHDHFAAASAAGRVLLRYINHELLLPWQPGAPPRFKVNPRLGAARLGPGGWQALVSALRMAQTDPRPYFTGYHNGKSAVAVAHGLAAAGVHGWHLAEPFDEASAEPPPEHRATLAGPSILHVHRSTPEAFRAKYLAIAAASGAGPRPFEPCPAEEAALALLRSGDGRDPAADPEAVGRELDALYHRLTSFTGAELDLLEEAGLIFAPKVETLPAASC
jgi:hypothetical protein